MTQKPDHILDLRGGVAPFSLLMISRTFREMADGEVLEIHGCDRELRSDLFRILPPLSWRLIGEDGPPLHRIQLKKHQNN